MSIFDEADAGAIENCVDDISELIAGLNRYSEAVLAQSLALHLSGLLGAMREAGQCSTSDIEAFVANLRDGLLDR